MSHIRPPLKREIENAYEATESSTDAARVLGISYQTFKKYAKLYGIFRPNGNRNGAVRPKINGAKSKYNLSRILNGEVPTYNHNKLKERLLRSSILKNECAACGFSEMRTSDAQVPLKLYFKDGNGQNLKLENLELRCYNCMFLTSGFILLERPIQHTRTDAEDIQTFYTEEELIQMRDELANEIELQRMTNLKL